MFQLASEHEVEVFLRGNPSQINENLPLDEQASLLPYNTEMEFPRNRLKLGMQIGSGAFGRVVRTKICLS
jgi:FMS-like tyrosine kinase 1